MRLSSFSLTATVISKKDIYCNDKLDREAFITAILPPKEREFLFHIDNFLLKFSTTGFQTTLDLVRAPIGSPRYKSGNFPTFQWRFVAKSLTTSSKHPAPIIALLAKLIFKPEASSKQLEILFNTATYSHLEELNNMVSSAHWRWMIFSIFPPTPKPPIRPSPFALTRKALGASITIVNKKGERGSSCLCLLQVPNNRDGDPFIKTKKEVVEIHL